MALTADLIDNPAQWRLGMRLGRDRLDVTLDSPLAEGSLMVHSLEFDEAAPSALKALEACVYDNPLLLCDFQKITCIIDTDTFLVLPPGLDGDDAECLEARNAVFAATFPDFSAGGEVDTFLSPTGVPGVAIMAGVDAGIAAFLRRTFFNVRLLHNLSPLCRYFLSVAVRGNQSRVYANLRPGATDIIVTRSGNLLLANSYATPTVADTVYFILAVRQLLGLPEGAETLLSGSVALREEVMPALREVVPSVVMPVIFPSVIFRAGKDAMRAPFDLILLPLCE